MYPMQTTWVDVWQYGYIQDKAGTAWKILEEKDGWMLLQNQAGQQASMMRPDPMAPVTALLLTEQEAFAAIYRAFPGAQIIEVKEN